MGMKTSPMESIIKKPPTLRESTQSFTFLIMQLIYMTSPLRFRFSPMCV